MHEVGVCGYGRHMHFECSICSGGLCSTHVCVLCMIDAHKAREAVLGPPGWLDIATGGWGSDSGVAAVVSLALVLGHV